MHKDIVCELNPRHNNKFDILLPFLVHRLMMVFDHCSRIEIFTSTLHFNLQGCSPWVVSRLLISMARVVESLIIYHPLSWVNVISIHFLFLIYANEPFRSSIVSIGSKSGTTLNKHMPFKSTGRGRAGTNIFHLLKLFEKDANDIFLTLAFQKCLTSR